MKKRGRRGKRRSLFPFLALAAVVTFGLYIAFRSDVPASSPAKSPAIKELGSVVPEAPTAPPRVKETRTPTHSRDLPSDFESATARKHPVYAIVLDDVGFDAEALRRIALLDGPLALAVIPSAPHAREAASLAGRKGWDLLVHLPMVPESGKGEADAIGPGDDDATIAARVARAIDNVPGATGLNNHQGSRATSDARVVRAVLEVVGERGLFFLDSRTTAASVGESEARRLGIRTVARDVFLDDAAAGAAEPGGVTSALQKAWDHALATATRKGACVIVAHPHPATLDFLSAHLAPGGTSGRVRVSDLVD